MSRLLDQTSIARQTAHHHINLLSDYISKHRLPAVVSPRKTRQIAHYKLTPAGVHLCMTLLKYLSQ